MCIFVSLHAAALTDDPLSSFLTFFKVFTSASLQSLGISAFVLNYGSLQKKNVLEATDYFFLRIDYFETDQVKS